MKRMYTITDRPDQWMLFTIARRELEEGEEPIEWKDDIGDDGILYFVAGSWRGGYLYGDEYRLNSGIEAIDYDEDEGDYLFHGFSGSVYAGKPYNYGATSYTLSAIASRQTQIDNQFGENKYIVNTLTEEEAMEYIKTMLESEEESA